MPDVPKDEYGNEKARPIVGIPEQKKDTTDAVEDATHSVAPTLKVEEASEPILRENPNRFVLFPIKYNEVRVTIIVFDVPSSEPRNFSLSMWNFM